MGLVATPAILLRAIDYGESDRVVTLLGRETGVVGAIARGARKSQRRFGGGLGLAATGEAALRDRHGAELYTLERFDVSASRPSLATDVARMAHAAYVAELTAKLCAPRQAEPGVYDWLAEFLDLLERDGAEAARLRVFELGLLERLGFQPALAACVVCGRTDLATAGAWDVRWDVDRGGVVCKACGARGRPMRPVVRLALAALGRAPLAGAGEAAAGMAADVAHGCREALQESIATHLSAPLKSLEFMAKLAGAGGGG